MLKLLAALIAASAIACGAHAQQYPNRTLRIVVPFAPGGSTDIVARLIADKLAAPLGQAVVVENRAGAAGNLGADAVAKAAPDGHTLLMATTGVMAINNALYKNAGYDAAKDLEAVIFVASITNVLAVPVELPARSVAELISLAKIQPLSFASSGAGSSTHLSGELFKSLSGIDALHIPYKGSAQALTDVVAGRVSMIFDNMPSALPFIKAGKLRALAVTGLKRSPALPDAPTVVEAGVKGYESLSWSGIAVPAGTPRDSVARLNREIGAIIGSSEMRARFSELGAESVGGPPETFAEHVRGEREKWGRLVRERNITVN